MPLSASFSADYYFVEDERNYATRISAETLGGGAKPIQRKGHFDVAWHTTHDTADYNRIIACIIPILTSASGQIGSFCCGYCGLMIMMTLQCHQYHHHHMR